MRRIRQLEQKRIFRLQCMSCPGRNRSFYEPEDETVTEGNRAGELHQDRLWFLESMDRISRAMQGTEGLEQVGHVLETVLPIFGCDRVWLAYPCDTESRTWRMVAQHTCQRYWL
jgi:hypothetical protein